MNSNLKAQAKAALDAFYSACAEPIKEYEVRLTEIQNEFDDGIAPLKKALEDAEAQCHEVRQQLREAGDKANPELKARYNLAHKQAYYQYERATLPLDKLCSEIRSQARHSYDELLHAQFAESDWMKEFHLSTGASLRGIKGKPEKLNAREITLDRADDIIFKLFQESLKPHEKERDALIKPHEKLNDLAAQEATRELSDAYDLAQEKALEAKRQRETEGEKLYKLYLQARADANAECQTKLKSLQDELKKKLAAVFEMHRTGGKNYD